MSILGRLNVPSFGAGGVPDVDEKKREGKSLEDFGKYRSEFPITEAYTFMNHAAISPLSQRVVHAVRSLLHEFSHHGIAHYPKWIRRIAEVRESFARLIHCGPREIAFVGNTSEGLSAIASGLTWKDGDGILVPRPEFPANIYPWMNLERHGVKVHFIERKEGRFGVKEIHKVLRPGTKLISVSSVDFATGFYCDLEALGDFCRKKGLLFCVDAIQSLGIIPMDVKGFGIHFLAAGGHKWLLSTMGCGVLFIDSDVNDLVHPDRVGWKSVVDEMDFFRIHFDMKPDALRFESGSMNVVGVYALGEAIELLLELGIERIQNHVLAINNLLLTGLMERKFRIASPLGEGERSGILSFFPPSDPKSLFDFLTDRKITVSLRNHLIRLSPHFYNTKEDVQRFFNVLDSFHS